ncbi:adenylate/guanylate cyclase domain-containing protein [Candidatus Nitrosotenuis chungbukensis]|uniref:adenylate/guanylate cyclase domain-containing protein n=1 Tax=Candidatus Nitrosotenuis chungbukensis TaxID=1353246 RepID=UPI000694E1A0|nr:adenylate/guanylate cyclase domain-containing protein [Candidatus Nitrosotenuis chungbukensis]WKT57643.1 adenylate/guanylate cyclase domain-containing protein [Candidatus Nitrosotenuis chungbukensis]
MIDISTAKSDTARLFSGSLVEPEAFLKEKIQEQESESSPSSYCVVFSEKSVRYCIGIVDMVGSTKMAASLGMSKMSRYYQNFLNLMSKIIEVYDGRVIKNVGDCLLFCFPQTAAIQDKSAIAKCLECSLAMIDAHKFLCSQMRKEGLPGVDYRISIDYGHVIPMKASDSKSLDMIGPAVNMCSKINRCAEKNGIVAGGDLYHIAKQIDGVAFKEIKGYSAGFKLSYPVYQLTRLRKDESV